MVHDLRSNSTSCQSPPEVETLVLGMIYKRRLSTGIASGRSSLNSPMGTFNRSCFTPTRGNVVKYNIQIQREGRFHERYVGTKAYPLNGGRQGVDRSTVGMLLGIIGSNLIFSMIWTHTKKALRRVPLCGTVCGKNCTEASTSRRSTMARSHMNMPIICARSFCGVNEVPDFTNCKRVPGRAYNGANGKKIATEYQGERCILEFPLSGQGRGRSCPTRIAVSCQYYIQHGWNPCTRNHPGDL